VKTLFEELHGVVELFVIILTFGTGTKVRTDTFSSVYDRPD